ncbi:hypothetical protein ACIQNK_10535 [Streptomyces sp. NPDC091273]|uniref:hypothetical protein n=1 Tax=Streptomyces sp. NPDC091273 TaxID=3365982 RepID=UPI0038125F31
MSDGDTGGGPDDAGAQLAVRVFAGEERWGWEYVEPPSLVPHHLADKPPVWTEPSFPDLLRLEAKTDKKSGKGTGCAIVLVLGIGVFGGLKYGILLLAIFAAIIMAPRLRLSAARGRAQRRRERLWREHQQRVDHWRSLLAEHEDQHRLRSTEVDLWYPLRLDPRPSRIDVFGGTGNGWASLLATVGGSLLGSGQAVLVMDFSQQSIALELAFLAAHRDVPVEHVPLPAATVTVDLLDGFTPEELAECLAEAFQSMRPEGAEVDLHSIDVDLIETTVRTLDTPVTYARLAAGLRVLLRIYDPGAYGGPLSPQEVEALSRAIDLVGQGERVQNELRYVRGLMELMAKSPVRAGADLSPSELWQPGRLTILATDDLVERRKDLTDRITFFWILHQLRQRRFTAGSGMLVIAGADRLGRAALESMARQARAAGIRLTLLFEHLREDTVKVAGGSDSATVFMRIGNGHEARDAAQFIGQDYKFLINQLTKQVGETLTEGRGSSYGEQDGESTSTGSNKGGSFSRSGLLDYTSGRSWGTSQTFTTSLSRSWQETTNTSTAHSTTRGENLSRVYEFTVEPTQLQALPATGMVVVEAGPQGRRAVFADCNPGITGLPRLSSLPRPALP